MKPTQDKVAVVLAAGKGTRMKTDQPKVAVELNGKPLLLHVLDHLKGSGIEQIVVVVGYKKNWSKHSVPEFPEFPLLNKNNNWEPLTHYFARNQNSKTFKVP